MSATRTTEGDLTLDGRGEVTKSKTKTTATCTGTWKSTDSDNTRALTGPGITIGHTCRTAPSFVTTTEDARAGETRFSRYSLAWQGRRIWRSVCTSVAPVHGGTMGVSKVGRRPISLIEVLLESTGSLRQQHTRINQIYCLMVASTIDLFCSLQSKREKMLLSAYWTFF